MLLDMFEFINHRILYLFTNNNNNNNNIPTTDLTYPVAMTGGETL